MMGRKLVFFAYNLLLLLASAVLLPYSLYRGWKRGQPWRRVPERLGFLPGLFHQTAGDSIWLHAVSVGEVTSCGQLLQELRRRFPAAPLFVSTTTATGQQMALEKLGGKVDGIFYAPLDLAFVVRRVLRRLRPRLVIVAETEIWPNLFRETKRTGAGLLLVNGRISDQSAASYRRFRFFFRHVLRCPGRILAQSATDRERFIAAGAPAEMVTVGGNLKYDFKPATAELPAELQEFLARLRPEPLLLAGSTREDEEGPVVEAFRLVAQSKPRALLVIAPRHPQRFDEAAEVLAAAGIPYLRRSGLGRGKSVDLSLPGILLLDSLGELASLYRMAQVVFVGGSLNGWGGHNVLEPALYGRPVVVGPHMQNFRSIAEALLSNGGMLQVAGAAELGPALLRLVESPDAADQLGARGRQLAEAQRGATENAAEECARLFEKSIPRTSPALGRALLLAAPALGWEAVARLRCAAYARGWLTQRRLKAFTLCVGNLTAGGAGKTPLVAWLVERLSSRGYSPAVLTRGYRRSSTETLVLHPGDDAGPAECGDEAAVLLRHFARSGLDASIGIGASRYEAGQRLLSAHSATGTVSHGEAATDILILDDGFQHLALERDVDLVLIDVTNPFGGGRMLPLGRLREPLTSLHRASAIVLTRTEPGRRYDELEHRLRELNPHAPIFRSWTRPAGVVQVHGDTESPPAKLAGRRIAAFCGLGNPESFWRVLRLQGWNVVQRLSFSDHHRYSPEDLRRIADEAAARNAELLLTTEKDVVNLIQALEGLRASPEGDGPWARQLQDLHWLRIETVVEQGDELLRWIEARMAERGRKRPPAKPARLQVRA
jgi:3-deoxy-D-manno-octulosonic-acid transferase